MKLILLPISYKEVRASLGLLASIVVNCGKLSKSKCFPVSSAVFSQTQQAWRFADLSSDSAMNKK